MNEVDGMIQKDYSKDMGDAYRKERFVILREDEDEGGRVMIKVKR